MQPRKIFTRRFLFGFVILLLLTGVNVGLFWYARHNPLDAFSFVQKTDGTIFFGKVRLLDGGYLQLDEVYTFHRVDNPQGMTEGGDFRIESLNPETLTIVREDGFDGIRIGPADIKQWGDIPTDSVIGKQIIRLMNTSH